MSAIFTTAPGTILVAKSDASQDPRPALLSIDGIGGRISAGVVASGINLQASVHSSLTPTVGGPSYLYVFGDAMMMITVHLTVFEWIGCNGSGSDSSGIAKTLKYYEKNKIRPDKVNPVGLTYAGVKLNGLIKSVQMGTTIKHKGLQTSQAVLTMLGWYDAGSLGNETASSDNSGLVEDFGLLSATAATPTGDTSSTESAAANLLSASGI